jgi:uncharacterized protein
VADDVAEVVARFGAALRRAGVSVGADRCGVFARAVMLVRPGTVRGVRECAVATLATSREQAETVAQVFDTTFGGGAGPGAMIDEKLVSSGEQQSSIDQEARRADTLARAARAAREHEARARDGSPGLRGVADGSAARGRELASASERLAGTDFAELSPDELLLLAGAMRRLTLAVPLRRSRRQRRGPRGRQADLRSTLRHARRTGAEPFGIIRKNPVRRPRKLVVLCDISGSMEPYARAMLQLLYCAAGGARAEVFSFATRLTRLTGALAQPRPALALQHAGQAAPDWLGGTRIGPCLKDFNDAFGCRGLARGAVVVVVSDGWDTGDPGVLRREMARLSRVAFRIVWVNPRAHRPGYRPLAGGMAAAWPYCDAVVSAHRLDALGELTAALGDPVRRRGGTASHNAEALAASWQSLRFALTGGGRAAAG